MSDETERALDGYLIALVRDGSREAFDRLARRWTPKLIRYATRVLGRPEVARDIVQETWISVIRGLERLDDSARFAAWIYSITHRKCADGIDSISVSAASRKASGRRRQSLPMKIRVARHATNSRTSRRPVLSRARADQAVVLDGNAEGRHRAGDQARRVAGGKPDRRDAFRFALIGDGQLSL
jgi:RNA polymerase sigma factor (sigma-70 family)